METWRNAEENKFLFYLSAFLYASVVKKNSILLQAAYALFAFCGG